MLYKRRKLLHESYEQRRCITLNGVVVLKQYQTLELFLTQLGWGLGWEDKTKVINGLTLFKFAIAIHHQHYHHWLSFVFEDDFLWTMPFHWHLFLLRDCQLPTGIFLSLRFLFTVSLNLHQSIPRRPSLSWEYRICLGSLESSLLCIWPTHLKLLWIGSSYMLGRFVRVRMSAFEMKSHHLTLRICRWCLII